MPDEIIPGGHSASLGRADVTTKTGHRGQEHQFSYRSTRVRVIMPPPADSNTTRAKPIAKAWISDFDAAIGGNSVKRKVINLGFVEDKTTHPGPVTKFNPPVEFRVTITADDTNRQPDKTRLMLGYCPKGGQWTPFSDVSLSDAQDELVVSISTWYDDPAIGTW